MIFESFLGLLIVDINLENLDIKDIKVFVLVEILKSGKCIMDNKCYDVLKYENYFYIKYQFEKFFDLKENGFGKYKGIVYGILNIVGSIKKVVILISILKINKLIIIKGELFLKMIDFGVEFLIVLFGIIKMGDVIIIDFNLNYY